MTSRALIITFAALAACKSNKSAPSSGSGSSTPPPVVADAPPAPKPVVDAAPPPATFNQQLTSDGVGPLTADTDISTLEKIFPGLTVKVEHDEGEDHSIDHYAVSAGTSHAFDVVVDNFLDKTHAFRVDVWTGLFATKDNIRIGSTVAELLAKDDSISCKRESYAPNAENFEHALFCESQRVPNLAFYLDDKALPGTDGKVVLAKVAQMKFVRIIWKNPKVKAAQ